MIDFSKATVTIFQCIIKIHQISSFFAFFLPFSGFFFLFHLIKKIYQEVLAEEIASVEHGYFHAFHTEGLRSDHLCSWVRGIVSGHDLAQGNSQGGSALQ